MARYHTLLVIEEDGLWGAEFGDYDKETVKYEMEGMIPQYRRKDLKIITTDEGQEEIDEAIYQLNLSIQEKK